MLDKSNLSIRLSQIIIIASLMCGCSRILPETTQIKNVSKQEVVEIHKRPDQGNVHGIKIRILGKIFGTATIQLMLNSNIYKKEEIKNTSNILWESDWHHYDAEIHYIPDIVTSGELTIKYEFLDF